MSAPTPSSFKSQVQGPSPGLFVPEKFTPEERLGAYEDFVWGERVGNKGGPRLTCLSASNENYVHAERVLAGPVRCTRLTTSGFTVSECDGPASVPPEFVYVTLYVSGQADLHTPRREEHIASGDICVNFSRTYQLDYSEGEHLRIMLPRSTIVQCHQGHDQALLVRRSDPVADVIWTAVKSLADAADDNDPSNIQLMSDLATVVLQDVIRSALTKPTALECDHTRNQSMEYIRDNLHRADLSIAEVAANARVSRASLYRSFRSVGGVKEFISSERIARAKGMLRLGRTDRGHIANVAYAVGFATPEQFSKVFKARTGRSPTQFVQSGMK